MTKVTCLKCDGSGLYKAPTSYGPYCFSCKGTGKVSPRKPKAAKVIVLSPMIRIADLCVGDPTKIDPNNTVFMNYYQLTVEQLESYCQMWNAGIREIPR